MKGRARSSVPAAIAALIAGLVLALLGAMR